MIQNELIARNVISRSNQYYVVSTVRTPYGPRSFETMIFRSTASGEVEDYMDLYCDRYDYAYQAKMGHQHLVANWNP
jgi:hypothetical protein